MSITPEPMSLGEACLRIFFTPARVFDRRAESGFAAPLLVVLAFVGLFAYGAGPYLAPVLDAEFARSTAATLRQNPRLTAEQLQHMRDLGEKFAIPAAIAGTAVAVLAVGFAILVVANALGGTLPLHAAFVLATFAAFPKTLAIAASGIVAAARDPSRIAGVYSVTLGPAFFLDPATTSPIPLTLAARLDVFTIWCTILVAIGLHRIARLSTPSAIAGAAIVWLVGSLPTLLSVLRTAA